MRLTLPLSEKLADQQIRPSLLQRGLDGDATVDVVGPRLENKQKEVLQIRLNMCDWQYKKLYDDLNERLQFADIINRNILQREFLLISHCQLRTQSDQYDYIIVT